MRTVNYQFKNLILVLVVLALGIPGWAQQTRDQHPNASGLSATTQSIPGMSQAQREGLKNPEQGTLVYQNDNAAGYYMNEGTPEQPRWTPVTFGGQMPAPEAVDNGSRAPLSGERGFLPPRLTDAQMNAIAGPAEGLLIYNLTQHKVCMYINSAWDCTVFYCNNYPAGTVHCLSGGALIQEVTNPATGDTWMNRNMGASRVAISSTDWNSAGDLYQWGRFSDGHQCWDSGTSTTLSSTDTPGHNLFIITGNVFPYDWRSPQNDNLWQVMSNTNNPCPCEYRVPTYAELLAEYQTWSQYNLDGAYASPLKWCTGGYRLGIDGQVFARYTTYPAAFIWTSSLDVDGPYSLHIYATNSEFHQEHRGDGRSVRCIKD